MAQNTEGFSDEIIMVAIPSQESCESSAGVPLLNGEQREEAEHAPSVTPDDNLSTTTEAGTAIHSAQIDESTQAESFWQRRRLANYAGINRNHPDVWSLFTSSSTSLDYSELEDDSGLAISTIAKEHTCGHRGCLENHGDLDAETNPICSKRTRGVNIIRTIFSIIQAELFDYYNARVPLFPQAVAEFKQSSAFVISKEWAFELLALLLAISSFMGITVLLSTQNGQVQPAFVDQISINALVAIFSTILRASVLFVITEVIGEMKWQWMELPRPLRDVEHFVNAASGPWGSLKFFFFLRDSPTSLIWAMTGAVVVITSAAIGPFSQQASATYTCYSNIAEDAQIRTATNVSSAITALMRGTAISSLTYGVADSFLTTPSLFECLDKTCSFNETVIANYTSIGICSSCMEANASISEVIQLNDIDSFVNHSLDSPAQPWPSGIDNAYALKLTAMFEPMPKLRDFGIEIAPRFADSMRGANTTVLIRALTKTPELRGVQSDETGSDGLLGLLAMNCTIFPCIRSYIGEVANGVFSEKVISRTPMALVLGPKSTEGDKLSLGSDTQNGSTFHGEFTQILRPCHKFNRTVASNEQNRPIKDWKDYVWRMKSGYSNPLCQGSIGHPTYSSIQAFVDKTITGSCNVSKLGFPPSLGGAEIRCGDKWWLESMMKDGLISFDSISAAFDGMSASMTELIRTNNAEGTNVSMTGFINKPAICVQTFWAWLLYPGVVLGLTTMLFIRTCLQSNMKKRQRPVWKSNVLPLLFYNIMAGRGRTDEEDAQHNVEIPLLTLAELGAVANHTVVWFDNEADAPGFMTKAGENSLKNVLVDLKENGVSALSKKKQVRPREKSKASGIVKFRTWLRRRRETGDGTEL
ncbi:hypothetical protein K456DRAFT_574870 [Colletotrichum gloeosporioides 23]|nr:hypothetical protein K456DRAFT_574870 [Colletotrichum gloeosporioides 23]